MPRINSATNVWPPLTMKKPTNIVAPKKIHMTIAVAFSVAIAASWILIQFKPPVQRADDERAEGADARGFDRRGDAEEDHAQHEQDQQDRRDGVAQQPQLLAHVHAFFERQRRSELWD